MSVAVAVAVAVAVVVQWAPFLLAGVVLSAVIATLLSARVLRRVVPANTVVAVPWPASPEASCRAAGVRRSRSLAGSCGVAWRRAALTFLLAAPAVNPVVLVPTAVAFPGGSRTVVARFSASLATAVLVGWWCLSRGRRLPNRAARDRC